jgi:dihydroxy-acid dehydratase
MGGPIGLVQDGDAIEIDMDRRAVSLQVPAGELEARARARAPHESASENGWLAIYARVVEPMSRGAVLVQPPGNPKP